MLPTALCRLSFLCTALLNVQQEAGVAESLTSSSLAICALCSASHARNRSAAAACTASSASSSWAAAEGAVASPAPFSCLDASLSSTIASGCSASGCFFTFHDTSSRTASSSAELQNNQELFKYPLRPITCQHEIVLAPFIRKSMRDLRAPQPLLLGAADLMDLPDILFRSICVAIL